MTTAQAVRESLARKARRRRRLIAYGQWKPFVDAQPVREHVEAVRATGMSLAGISKHTGVNIGSIDHLLYGKAPYPPAAKLRTENAQALLAYWPTLDDYDDGAVVDATGTRRRMQALAALGWPSTAVHGHVNHIKGKAVERLRNRKHVTARTARAVRDFYKRVSERPAEEYGVESWVAARTRGYAERFQYAPPAAWDDDTIEDPDARPDWTGYCGTDRGWWTHRIEHIPVCEPCQAAHDEWLQERRHLSPADRYRELGRARGEASNRGAAIAENARELMRLGADYEVAAQRIGVTRQHLQQELIRHPEQTAA